MNLAREDKSEITEEKLLYPRNFTLYSFVYVYFMEKSVSSTYTPIQQRRLRMNVRSLVSTLFVLTLLSSAPVVAQEPKQGESVPSLRSLQIDDTFKIKSVRSPSFSPDGKLLAYTVAPVITKRTTQKHVSG